MKKDVDGNQIRGQALPVTNTNHQMKITTATIHSATEMTKAIKSGLRIALHLESIERPSGLVIFCNTIEEARQAYKTAARGWEQFMVCEYPTDDLNDYKQIAIGWV
jgi:hypothetical protein